MAKNKKVTERPAPPYHSDTFKEPKVKELIKYVLSREGWIVEIEGGKRGSKDVVGIYAWSQYLMVTPDKEHLVLGKTLEHAIVTVLKAQGFGLYHTIPSGEFTREALAGGTTRGVFKFNDAYGTEKIIYFYGNEKAQDYSKFKGFSLGSVYINEANEQHTTGIREAKERTNAAQWPRVIITQNPKSAAHKFYTDFEEPLIYGEEKDMLIKNVKLRFEDAFLEEKEKMQSKMKKEKNKLISNYLSRKKVSKADYLPRKEYGELMNKVRNFKEEWNKKIRNLQVKDFTDDYADPDNPLYTLIHNSSMEAIINYKPYFTNPNEVKNGLAFAYFHFTHDDNPSMSDVDRARINSTYDVKSPTFKRDIRGERATVDNAIWSTFSDENIYEGNVDASRIVSRYIGTDLGYDHPFANVEALILEDNTVLIHDELFIVPSDVKEKANNVEYIKELRKFINKRYDGYYDAILVDPSAKGFINQCISEGLIAGKAKNRVRNFEPGDASESDSNPDKRIAGINLVREGFRLGKIKIHSRCKNTIKQVRGYAFDEKKLENGVEVPYKINDDLPDAIRYVINTVIGYVAKWEDGSETDIDVEEGQEEVLGEQVSPEEENFAEQKQREQEIAKQLINAYKGKQNGNNSGWLF